MQKEWLVGIDGGGTKTTAYAAAPDGSVLARALESASNYHVVGVDEFKRVIISLLRQLTDTTGLKFKDLRVLSLGLAGVDRPDDAAIVRGALADLGINCDIVLNHDAAIALAAGAGSKHGVVLIAGTGSIAYGVNACGADFRAGGFGHLVGDEGSGYAIAAEAVRKALMATEGRWPETALLDVLLQHAGLASKNDLVGYIYKNSSDKASIAGLAEAVVKCAATGDAVANEILVNAGRSLASLARSVISRGFDGEDKVKLIVCGSILTKVRLVQDVVRSELGGRVELIPLESDAALGAVYLAAELLAKMPLQ